MVCGLKSQKAGRNCLIVSAGQNALHFSSGTFGLLGRLPDGTEVDEPLEAVGRLPEGHPYSKIGPERMKEYASETIPFFASCGVGLKGFGGKNGWRLTPTGTFKKAWLALEDVSFLPSKEDISGRKALIVNFESFIDFNTKFIAIGLENRGIECRMETLKLKEIDRLRKNPTEMRSVNIARVMDREDNWKEFGKGVRSMMRDEDIVILPEVFGLENAKVADWVGEMVNAKVFFVGTMPPSVPGIRAQMALKKAFEAAGGTFLMGDEAVNPAFENGKVKSVRTVNLGNIPLEAENFVLASGHLFGKGLVTTPGKVEEPVFGLDVDYPSDRSEWYDRDFFARQNYIGFGVRTDSSFHALKEGETISNLFVIGSELGGCNSLYEGSGAGVAIMTAMRVADEIIGG